MLTKRGAWAIVFALLIIQAVQVAFVVHRESLTFDEDNHIFAGYMMHKTGDYGLNPEHPPLVKLLATLPLLGKDLWTPPLQGRDFKSVSQTALGDAAFALGQKDEARQAWQAAIAAARHLEPDAQPSYIPDLETKLRKSY